MDTDIVPAHPIAIQSPERSAFPKSSELTGGSCVVWFSVAHADGILFLQMVIDG